jgi:hypothetical protein
MKSFKQVLTCIKKTCQHEQIKIRGLVSFFCWLSTPRYFVWRGGLQQFELLLSSSGKLYFAFIDWLFVIVHRLKVSVLESRTKGIILFLNKKLTW